jgi:hypothetical protein
MGAKKQTIGYRYFMSLLSGLCRGPIDELVEIQSADKQAWSGKMSENGLGYIDKPNLFGGEKKEGGIQGPFYLGMGAADQVYPGAQGSDLSGIGGLGGIFAGLANRTNDLPDVKASIGDPNVSEFRGVVTLWFNGMVSAMNPYLKEWRFRVRRWKSGWHNDDCWYPEKALIVLSGDVLSLDSQGEDIKTTLTATGGSIRFTGHGDTGDYVTVSGTKFELIDSLSPETPTTVRTGDSASETAQDLKDKINAMASALGVQASGDGATITISLASGQAAAIKAMNPAHIVYECCTNPAWGRGASRLRMDENTWVYAANTFCSEGFGLCLAWYRKEDIDVFIKKVCDLAGMAVYTNRETGLISVQLIRDDYNPADLPLFTPDTGLVEIREDISASATTAYNEVIGTSKSPISNIDIQVRAQNLASFQAQQSVSSLDQSYQGVPTKSLLSRLVLRDLRANAAGLKKYTVVLDRRGWRIAPGMVFRISNPKRGIENLVLRAGDIDDGNMTNGRITIKCAVDVFGLPETSYVVPVDNAWSPPSQVATPAVQRRLIEAGYRDIYLAVGAGDAEAAKDQAFIGQLAAAPNTTSYQYELATKAEGETEFASRATGSFTGYAKLAEAITPLQTQIKLTGLYSFTSENLGQGLLIGNEMVRFDAFDIDTNIATVARGTADTIPAAHAKNEYLWTVDDDLVDDGREYAPGEQVQSKVLTLIASDILAPVDAPTDTITLIGRVDRPYPPANVKVGDVSVFTPQGLVAEPVVSWAGRNRVGQQDALVGHQEAGLAGEEGQTYTIRVYDTTAPDVVLRTVTGLTDLTWTYTAALQAEDGGPGSVWIELESEREGLASWQKYRFQVTMLGGWGFNWGYNWGG